MNFYDTNISILKEKHKINLIDQTINTGNYRILKNNQGIYTGMVRKNENWIYIDYEDRRIKEFGENIKSGKRTIIVIGFGLGNCISKLLNNIGNSDFIVLENDIQMMNCALAIRDLSEVLNDNRIKLEICYNSSDINEILENNIKSIFFTSALDVIICPGYNEAHNEFTNTAIECIKKAFNNSIVNKDTMQVMSNDILKALFDNIPYIVKSSCANQLKDVFCGKTAVIVSSGPSLSKNLHILKEYNDKAVIITSARNVNYMSSEGIVPHLVCMIDHGDIVYDFLKDSFDKGLYFVSTEHANNKAIKNIENFNMFCTVLFHEFVSKITEREYEKFPSISSVAHLSTILAVYMGCKNVIFIGQDLAYTDNKSHDDFSGAKWGADLSNRDDLFYVEGNYNDRVLTDISLQNFRQWLEDYIYNNKEVRFINCTEGGAKIKGTCIAELRKTLDQLCMENINANEIIKNTFNNKIKFDKYRVIHQIMKLEEEITLIKSKYEEGIELCKIIYEFNKGNIKTDVNKVVQQFSEIDKVSEGKTYINSLINIIAVVPLKTIMQDTNLIENLSDSPRQRGIKYAKRNQAVCKLYIESMNKILELIHECIEELKNIS
ncbi:motility associated factor glycosyltransferase family protein [Clostridium sp. JS66]|uniref:motility associated factor glycosyltransferase family protein n=1 Tax=Clostridium sp. JS66 TaxID=3064705 RepID=UPI00298E8481|nr:6-hydroxymethylpterin diphosphokinase MptE-like protein [Clostridium sp. JS66]WPC40530.1 DUF115 domain-containing protein [Clostridium sp. JS66]